MPRLQRLRRREVLRPLRRAGFIVLGDWGRHLFLQYPDDWRNVVPIRVGENTGPVQFGKILSDVETGLHESETWL
jgi:predicted RNA binding protein YcfA (HicA-like mRNA interferase family)